MKLTTGNHVLIFSVII